MPVLPIREVTPPAVLKGQSNGRLPSNLLHAVRMPGGGRDALLVEPAARCFRALVAAAARDGILLMCTEGYRSYEKQLALWLDRYYVVSYKTSLYWDGRYWVKRPNVAVAARPGTSNHGLGIAVDLSEQLDGDPAPESISDRAVRWLIANAAKFGISAEIQSEDWHWRLFTGDAIPAAVLAHERSTEEDDMPWQLRTDPDFRALIERVEDIHNLNDSIPPDAPNKAEGAPIVTVVKDIQARLAGLETKLAALGQPTLDVDAFAAKLAPLVDHAVKAALDGVKIRSAAVLGELDTDGE